MDTIQSHPLEIILPCYVEQVDLHYSHENGENLIHAKYDFIFCNQMPTAVLPKLFNYGFRTEMGQWNNDIEHLSDASLWLQTGEEFQFSVSLCTTEKVELITGTIQFELKDGTTVKSHEIVSSNLMNTYNLKL